jgi:two-component system, NtrC family, response regulator GlrR
MSTSDFTEQVDLPGSTRVQGFQVVVTSRTGEQRWTSTGTRCAVGAHASNDLVVEAPQVSRFHCEFELTPRGLVVRDLGSSNGTFVEGVRVTEGFVTSGHRLTLGTATLDVTLMGENTITTSKHQNFGKLLGSSSVMRSVFAQLERAAATDITVLIEGETGTGKEEAAAGLHHASARANKPFVVIDCSALPPTLLESELFGHERGAFTGAHQSRTGAFEDATGGTVFLDELGELPLELQPKLLRVLEAKEFRRLGSNTVRQTDVRVVAATNRDLRKEINEGRFRADLFYRLAVLRVRIPPLRQHPDDIPLIAKSLLSSLGASPTQAAALCTSTFLASLRSAPWAGNVRELRNHLETCLLFVEGLPPGLAGQTEQPAHSGTAAPSVDASQPLANERKRHTEAFERAYVDALLALHGNNVNAAATAAGVDRAYLYRLMKKVRPLA